MTLQMKSGIRAFLPVWTVAFALAPMAGAASTDVTGTTRRRPLPPLETPIPRPADAATIYDSVGEEFRAIDRALFEDLPAEADDPQAIYLATGIANERMQGWLKDARPLGDKLIEASTLEYSRALDPQDGFTLGPAYLAPLRTTNRSLLVLVHDAAIRGESERLAKLLSVQITLAVRTAGDGTLPSSISAISAVQQHMRSVDGLLARGLLDQATASALLDIRTPLASIREYGTVVAMEAELEALKLEFDRILLTPFEQRPAAVAGLRITVPVKLDDAAIVAARQGAEAYLLTVAEALGRDDIVAARHDIVATEQRLRDGAFGELLKVLAPQMLSTVDLLIQSQADIASQRAVLESIVNGDSMPADHSDAGWYYQLAARAAAGIPSNSQSAIEELRIASKPSAETLTEARRAIEVHRESVIAPILLAHRSQRCTLPSHPTTAAGSGLVRACAGGLNGAVRLLLADAFGPGARPASATPQGEAAAICLRLAARFASLGSYSHSLVAHQVVRDLLEPLAQLERRGELTPALRQELAGILADLPETDPLGFVAATNAERAWLGSRTFPSGGASIVAFEQAQLATLDANEVAFLVAMFTAPSLVPYDIPRGSPLDGALVDIRPWFSLAAYKKASAQIDTVRARAQRAANSAVPIDERTTLAVGEVETAVTWLDVTVPVDIESKIREAASDHKALRALMERPSTTATASRKRPAAP
jgi:hypothetical protein